MTSNATTARPKRARARATPSPALPLEQAMEFYRRMLRIRRFEETAEEISKKAEISGPLHSCIGQEGEVVGACMALRREDYMVGNHRSHGHPIGKGAALDRLMAELLGRKTGINQGKGGSMHLSDFGVGSLGETSIVGSGIPVAVGAALGAQMQKSDRVALCFFGDGASNEGTFHEGLNLAAVWKLPVIFICENNGYGSTTSTAKVLALPDVAARAAGYGLPGLIVDGQDAVAVYEAVSAAVGRARAGDGPSLIEAKTYRYRDHSLNLGRSFGYRPEDELARWRSRDPLALFRTRLMQEWTVAATQLDAVAAEVEEEIAAALAFARNSPFPDPDEAFDHVYTNPFPIRRPVV